MARNGERETDGEWCKRKTGREVVIRGKIFEENNGGHQYNTEDRLRKQVGSLSLDVAQMITGTAIEHSLWEVGSREE